MPRNRPSFRLPARLDARTELSAIHMPTRLRTILTRRLPVFTAGELGALPARRMEHVIGLGDSTRPVLTALVEAVADRLGPHQLAPRLAGDLPLESIPLLGLDELPRSERIVLEMVGVRTLDALGAMPRAVLARIEGIGADALGRLTALCLGTDRLTTLAGLLAALEPRRRDAVELVYGLRDGVYRSPRQVARILRLRLTAVLDLVAPQHLAPLPPMQVLAAAVREAIEPVGFAVVAVVAGRLARRLPPGPDDMIDPRAFARLGALLVREGSEPQAAEAVRVVADGRWSPTVLAEMAATMGDNHANGHPEARTRVDLLRLAESAGHGSVPGDALMVAVAGMCPGVVLSIGPGQAPPPLTDPEVRAIISAGPAAILPPDISGPPRAVPPVISRPPAPLVDTTEEVYQAVVETAARTSRPADPLPGVPVEAIADALGDGVPRAMLIPRGPDVLDRLAAAVSDRLGPESTRIIEVGRAITDGLRAMTDAPALDPTTRAARLATALDAALDIGGAARPGRVTLVADLSLALTLGMGEWIAAKVRQARDGSAGLLLLVAPGVVDDDGLLIDRLHRLPGIDRAGIVEAGSPAG